MFFTLVECSLYFQTREIRNAHRILVGKPEDRSRHIWEDNIKKQTLKKYCLKMWTGFFWLRIGFGDVIF
jgi:hypothetical protein